MKIGQVIDNIFEDNSKQYQGISDTSISYTLKYNEHNEAIILVGPFGATLDTILMKELSEIDWKLIQKPVTFMEAVESMKPFRVEHSLYGNWSYGGITEFLDEIVRTLGCEGKKIILTEGKFYIKEDN